MPLALSQAVLVLEGIFLVGLAGVWFVGFLGELPSLARTEYGFVAILIGAAIVFFVGVASRVMVKFLHLGGEGLRHLSKAWWWLAAAGVLFSFSMALALYCHWLGSRAVQEAAYFGQLGLLFLVPLGHMALELVWRPRYKNIA